MKEQQEFDTFEKYYEVVIGNVSHSILPDRLYDYSERRIVEIVQRMYYFDIPYKKAAVLIETFFAQFEGLILLPSNDDNFNWNTDNFGGAV
jgi:hypothetical protein